MFGVPEIDSDHLADAAGRLNHRRTNHDHPEEAYDNDPESPVLKR